MSYGSFPYGSSSYGGGSAIASTPVVIEEVLYPASPISLAGNGGMELWYGDFAIHQLGDLQVTQSEEYENPAAPQRARVTLRVNVILFERSYAENYRLIQQLKASLRTQHQTLLWRDLDAVNTFADQTAVVTSEDIPESWGTYELPFNLTFQFDRQDVLPNNVTATFRKTGSAGPTLTLGNVYSVQDGYQARRFNEMRSHRMHAGGQITLGGKFLVNTRQSLGARRAELAGLVAQWNTEVNGADGTLAYGSFFNRVVRIEKFTAQINEAVSAVEWSLTATYTRFPDEAGYATCEFQATPKEQFEDGDQFLTFSGRILATDEALARAKLNTLRPAVLADFGFEEKHQIRIDSTSSRVDANEDGATFIELSFNEEYRKRKTDLISWTLQVADREDLRGGLLATTYSGTVIAGGATAGAAYATALAKARELGHGKHPFHVSTSETYSQRQVREEADIEFVRLEFSYEYQRTAGARAYLEVNSTTQTELLGNDSQSISGFVVAANVATAQSVYAAQVRNAFASSLVRDESTSTAEQRLQNGQAYLSQAVRLNFSFTVHKTKAATAKGIRYSLDVTRDFLANQKQTTFSGSVWAANRAAADAFLATIAGGLALGTITMERRTEAVDSGGTVATPPSAFIRLDFNDTYSAALTDESGIIETEVTTEIQYSGTRWTVQDIPTGVSVVQNTGITPGRRRVTGRCKATSQTLATAWALKQRRLLTGDADGHHFEEPPRLSPQFVFVPRIEGVAEGAEGPGETANATAVQVSFEFGEILPNYPLIVE